MPHCGTAPSWERPVLPDRAFDKWLNSIIFMTCEQIRSGDCAAARCQRRITLFVLSVHLP